MRPPFVLALAGGTASGKSTLAEALMPAITEALPGVKAELVSMDSFMRRTDPTAPQAVVDGVEMFNANHPESTDNAAVLSRIGSSDADLLVLEGLMPLAVPELRSRADLRVFVELEADIRAIRRMERDIRTHRSGGDPVFILAYYVQCARIGHRLYVQPSQEFADVIVRGDMRPGVSARVLVDLLVARLSGSRL